MSADNQKFGKENLARMLKGVVPPKQFKKAADVIDGFQALECGAGWVEYTISFLGRRECQAQPDRTLVLLKEGLTKLLQTEPGKRPRMNQFFTDISKKVGGVPIHHAPTAFLAESSPTSLPPATLGTGDPAEL